MKELFWFSSCTSLLETVLNKYQLNKKVIAGTTDQGSNIKRTMLDLSEETGAAWIPCSAHKMQLCINKALEQTQAKVLLDKCQQLSTFFRNCSAAMAALSKAMVLTSSYSQLFLLVGIRFSKWQRECLNSQKQFHVHIPTCHQQQVPISPSVRSSVIFCLPTMRSPLSRKLSCSWNQPPPSHTGLVVQSVQQFHTSISGSTVYSQQRNHL